MQHACHGVLTHVVRVQPLQASSLPMTSQSYPYLEIVAQYVSIVSILLV